MWWLERLGLKPSGTYVFLTSAELVHISCLFPDHYVKKKKNPFTTGVTEGLNTP